MNIRRELKGKQLQLFIEGSCTIYSVKELYSAIADDYGKNAKMTIDVSCIDEFDTAAFQFFLALKKDAFVRKRKVSIVNHSQSFLKFLDLFGVAGLFHDRLAISKNEKSMFPFKYGTKITTFE